MQKSVSGTRGREFESRRPDQLKNLENCLQSGSFFYAKVLKYKKESFVKHWGLDINGKYIYINDMFSEIIR